MLAVENLEAHRVQVNGVRVVGGIDEAPDLGAVEGGLFGDGIVPVATVQQKQDGLAGEAAVFVEREQAGLGRVGLRDLGTGRSSLAGNCCR